MSVHPQAYTGEVQIFDRSNGSECWRLKFPGHADEVLFRPTGDDAKDAADLESHVVYYATEFLKTL